MSSSLLGYCHELEKERGREKGGEHIWQGKAKSLLICSFMTEKIELPVDNWIRQIWEQLNLCIPRDQV